MTLGLGSSPVGEGSGRAGPAPVRLVAVAVDAAGAGGARPYTYAVPPRLADLEDGEAVLVEFGRRQALGVILGSAEAPPGVDPRPIVDRVRADGPLLPPLTLRLAGWIATHYLAPPALVIRAMLPPGSWSGSSSSPSGHRVRPLEISTRSIATCSSSSRRVPGRSATWPVPMDEPARSDACAGSPMMVC